MNKEIVIRVVVLGQTTARPENDGLRLIDEAALVQGFKQNRTVLLNMGGEHSSGGSVVDLVKKANEDVLPAAIYTHLRQRGCLIDNRLGVTADNQFYHELVLAGGVGPVASVLRCLKILGILMPRIVNSSGKTPPEWDLYEQDYQFPVRETFRLRPYPTAQALLGALLASSISRPETG